MKSTPIQRTSYCIDGKNHKWHIPCHSKYHIEGEKRCKKCGMLWKHRHIIMMDDYELAVEFLEAHEFRCIGQTHLCRLFKWVLGKNSLTYGMYRNGYVRLLKVDDHSPYYDLRGPVCINPVKRKRIPPPNSYCKGKTQCETVLIDSWLEQARRIVNHSNDRITEVSTQ